MPLIHTVTATESQVSALFAEMESFPEYRFLGGYGDILGSSKAISGFNYFNAQRREYVSIEVDRPLEAGDGHTVVRLYVDRAE